MGSPLERRKGSKVPLNDPNTTCPGAQTTPAREENWAPSTSTRNTAAIRPKGSNGTKNVKSKNETSLCKRILSCKFDVFSPPFRGTLSKACPSIMINKGNLKRSNVYKTIMKSRPANRN